MPVDLGKVEREAPHMVSLVKQVGVVLEKQGLNPDRYKAAVIATLDHSGSAQRLYEQGQMQDVSDIGFAAGLAFDDDGSVPFSLFADRVDPMGDMTLSNCRGFISQHTRSPWGMTDYVSALEWIVDEAGFGRVDLGIDHRGHAKRGLFKRGSGSAPSLGVKATAQYPTYALFVTDGEPNRGTEAAIEAYLTAMSQLPIFVQFVGVGPHNFEFLRELDDLGGRLVDNANFFDAKDAGHDQGKMLELMLGEFPDYYVTARKAGLIQ